jgi:ParB-like chromosome segregation protein Spo0J
MKNDRLTIEHLSIDALVPYARNSRTHSAEQVAQIAGSIKEFGFTNPVLIDADGGIIAGHGRVLAARKLGLAEVPCIRLGYLTEIQKRAYVIADNKLALNAGWDEEALRLELGDLRAADVDLSLTGFDGEEIESFLNLPESEDDYPQSSAAEIDVDGMNMECQCPKCGFEFDPKKK